MAHHVMHLGIPKIHFILAGWAYFIVFWNNWSLEGNRNFPHDFIKIMDGLLLETLIYEILKLGRKYIIIISSIVIFIVKDLSLFTNYSTILKY